MLIAGEGVGVPHVPRMKLLLREDVDVGIHHVPRMRENVDVGVHRVLLLREGIHQRSWSRSGGWGWGWGWSRSRSRSRSKGRHGSSGRGNVGQLGNISPTNGTHLVGCHVDAAPNAVKVELVAAGGGEEGLATAFQHFQTDGAFIGGLR